MSTWFRDPFLGNIADVAIYFVSPTWSWWKWPSANPRVEHQ